MSSPTIAPAKLPRYCERPGHHRWNRLIINCLREWGSDRRL